MTTTLDTFQKGQFSLRRILDELHQVHRQSLGDIALLMGVSTNALYRVRRGHTASMEIAPVVRLCSAYGLPYAPVYYQNAVAALQPAQRQAMHLPDAGDLFDAEGRLRSGPATDGSASGRAPDRSAAEVLFDVRIPRSDFGRFARADTPSRISLVRVAAMTRQLGNPPWQPQAGHLYVDMQGNHMIDRYRKAPNIPPGAIVEVRPLGGGEQPDNDEIVFAQVGDLPATCYLYRHYRDANGEHEEFRGLPPDEPPRDLHRRAGSQDPPLDQQRALIGQATRIVDYRLQPLR